MVATRIANTYNFFEIDNQKITFWGLDILPKWIPLTKRVKALVRKLNLPFHEVVEIYNDETLQFFLKIYY
jgi:hypothetical protein